MSAIISPLLGDTDNDHVEDPGLTEILSPQKLFAKSSDSSRVAVKGGGNEAADACSSADKGKMQDVGELHKKNDDATQDDHQDALAKEEVVEAYQTLRQKIFDRDFHGFGEVFTSLATSSAAKKNAVLTTTNASGSTLLHEAGFKGEVDIVNLLLDHSADIFLEDHWGSTALHLAASQDHAEVVFTMLEKTYGEQGEDPDAPDYDKMGPGVEDHCIEYFVLQKRQDGQTPLGLAEGTETERIIRRAVADVQRRRKGNAEMNGKITTANQHRGRMKTTLVSSATRTSSVKQTALSTWKIFNKSARVHYPESHKHKQQSFFSLEFLDSLVAYTFGFGEEFTLFSSDERDGEQCADGEDEKTNSSEQLQIDEQQHHRAGPAAEEMKTLLEDQGNKTARKLEKESTNRRVALQKEEEYSDHDQLATSLTTEDPTGIKDHRDDDDVADTHTEEEDPNDVEVIQFSVHKREFLLFRVITFSCTAVFFYLLWDFLQGLTTQHSGHRR
ncbi:unnamed protein product [Amoebophrya sp. A120]|nr:unnamed protein product [Amoebophrya sp. A120]|eukprot:GSA120T00009796001.1